jgi:hypothetical protein
MLTILVVVAIALVLFFLGRDGTTRRRRRTVGGYRDAMAALERLSAEAAERARSAEATSPYQAEGTLVGAGRRAEGYRSPAGPTGRRQPPPPRPLTLAEHVANLIGWDEREPREPGPEGNARLTGTTGLVLVVLIFAEGLTLPFIVRLVSWHIAIGLALIPPLLVKLGSVLWRFVRYYLGDERYRRAGPPHPLLRAIGPLLFVTTLVLVGSGVALWLEGPSATLLFRIHQLTFFVWFALIAIHVGAHLLRAVRLGAADARARHQHLPEARGAAVRRSLVVASLLVGLGLGFASKAVASAWTSPRPAPAPTATAGAAARSRG